MEICVIDQQSALALTSDQVKSLVQEVFKLEGFPCDEVAIHFVPARIICDLHRQYFNDPSPTDCISFPVPPDTDDLGEYRILGDVFVCTDVAVDYAKSHGEDPYIETSLYVVHGLLHLMGYDDISEKDRSVMRHAEERHMGNLKKQDLLLYRK